MIKVYATEIIDGVGDAVANSSSIAYMSPAVEYTTEKLNTESSLKFAKANNLSIANPDQIDLFYLKSVLVSSGWNKNDDVFLSAKLWAARNTPEDKQFNFMHNEKDIIGHITGNYVTDFEGNLISEDITEIPNDINIVTTAVIYTSWSDPELRARMEKTINEIKEDKWFVSMECLFPNFDYALKNLSTGEIKIVERTEATAFLTKHLRAYGGSGVYEDRYKIGRVLLDLSFSGKGLVTKPANEKSLIIETSEKSISQEQNMSVELQKELDTVKAELAEAKKTIESLSTVKTQAETLQASLTEKDTALATFTAKVTDLESQMASLKTSLSDAVKSRDEAVAKYKDMEDKAKMAKRKAALAEAEVEESDVDSFLSLDDASFDKIVAVMKKGKSKKDSAKKEDKEDKVVCSENDEDEDIDIEETEDKSKAGLNDLGANDEDKANDLQKSIASWFETNVPVK